MAKRSSKSNCPINYGLEIFGDRWTLLVVRDLIFKNKRHYGELLTMEEMIPTNILSDRLALLEKAGIVSKTVDEENRSKRIYRLTRKGIDLLPVLVDIILWAAKYDKQTAADARFVRRAKSDRHVLLAEIVAGLS